MYELQIRQTLRLPRAFVLLAFMNFIVGSTLGGVMASNTAWWAAVASIHGELNPFGWLTMLIYGMTYVVLFLSLGLRLPKRWQGWLHAGCAEGGVVLLAVSLVWHITALYRLGLLLQTVSPFLFLLNIMSMVIARKRKREERSDVQSDVQSESGQRWGSVDIVALFGVVDDLKSTDRVAQRGTDVSLVVFLAIVTWTFIAQLMRPITWPYAPPQIPTLLVYYGWILGTVLAVALHLYPRLFGVKSISGWYAQIGQSLWGIAVLFLFCGQFWNLSTLVGGQIMGLAVIWQALGYLGTMRLRMLLKHAYDGMHRLNIVLWAVAWTFALVLGVTLVLGLSLDALAALHLLFLGWITTLVYSIGYRVFPLLLGRRPPHKIIVFVQVVTALFGAVLMPISLWDLQQGASHAAGVLAVAGILATIGALVFLLQWIIVKTD